MNLNISNITDQSIVDDVIDYMSSTTQALMNKDKEISELYEKVATYKSQIDNLILDNKTLKSEVVVKQASAISLPKNFEKVLLQLSQIGILKTASINDNITALNNDPNYAFELLSQVADMFEGSTMWNGDSIAQGINKQASLVQIDNNGASIHSTNTSNVIRSKTGGVFSSDVMEAKQKIAEQNKARECAFLRDAHKQNNF